MVERIGQVSVEGSQAGIVYGVDGISPTIIAGTHGYAIGYIATKHRTEKIMSGNKETTKTIVPINTDAGGVCRTIKAGYYKTGPANIGARGAFATTGVLEIENHSCRADGQHDRPHV